MAVVFVESVIGIATDWDPSVLTKVDVREPCGRSTDPDLDRDYIADCPVGRAHSRRMDWHSCSSVRPLTHGPQARQPAIQQTRLSALPSLVWASRRTDTYAARAGQRFSPKTRVRQLKRPHRTRKLFCPGA
jgi:hypothetical protein